MKAQLIGFFALTHLLTAAPTKVAVLGDSITFRGEWPSMVESAMRATPAFRDAEIVNFGLPSETVSGLSEPGHAGGQFPRPCLHERLGRILDQFQPEIILACYGMNDGIQMPADPERFAAFTHGMEKLKADADARKASIIFISPPLFMTDTPDKDTKKYDAVLDSFATWLNGKRAAGWKVVDIRPALKTAVAKAKQADPKFVYASDGVHPGRAGSRMIADAVATGIWPILGLPGNPAMAADGKALAELEKHNEILKLAWLSKTGHKRPGIAAGQPIDKAKAEAAKHLAGFLSSSAQAPTPKPAATSPATSVWNGYQRLDFTVAGRKAILVVPKSPAPGKPWIWRTEFFGHQPQGDITLLGKGHHVAWIDLQDLYGAPVAIEAMDSFHQHLTGAPGLSPKPVLEGFSRGGLFAFNWAAHRPHNVTALYVDAPVCDFKSWPGGKGKGPGSKGDWANLLKVYGFTEAEAMAYTRNPVDNLAPLATAKIPILAVIGQADEVVPVEENIDVVEKRYKALGGSITVIRKPGCKHHPHSLPDPAPIVDFVLKASAAPSR